MGCHILIGKEQGTDIEHACLFSSTTGVVFGPLFDSEEDAESFLKFCVEDPRKLHPVDLLLTHERWLENREEKEDV